MPVWQKFMVRLEIKKGRYTNWYGKKKNTLEKYSFSQYILDLIPHDASSSSVVKKLCQSLNFLEGGGNTRKPSANDNNIKPTPQDKVCVLPRVNK